MADSTRIDIDDSEADLDDEQRLLYRGELFTGEAVEHLGGAQVSLECYEDGVPHGPNKEWYQDGTLRSEGTSHRGRPVGVSREWHPNGTLAHERVFAEDGLTLLADSEWDEDGRPTRAWRRKWPHRE
ncbi:toxin-antitoxin system YwqK family antitoxin [Streptomyces longwoodensis]|uniref:toxin-antitoxin system YwqK family antitoxin n=1 Tax=Streptomyces longwoodensis TaxID=68231 RepID=UPI0036FCEF80